MTRDAKIGFGWSAIVIATAFLSSCGHPAYAAELLPSPLQHETQELLGDLITHKTGVACASPVVFDYGADWVLICQFAPTVWTLAASGDLYENGDLKTAIERNFR